MREIRTQIDINAPKAKVWQILMDFERYPEWNPFVLSISGDQQLDGQLTVILDNGGKEMTFTTTVKALVPQQTFVWLGKLLLPRIFDGRHIFELHGNGDTTTLVHREEFRGILVWPLLKMIGDQTRSSFEAMNQALKERAEAA